MITVYAEVYDEEGAINFELKTNHVKQVFVACQKRFGRCTNSEFIGGMLLWQFSKAKVWITGPTVTIKAGYRTRK